MRRVRGTAPICPRCGGYIPNNEQPGAYPGARSRVDNKTEVCSKCGQMEAMEQWAGVLMPMELWESSREFRHDADALRGAER